MTEETSVGQSSGNRRKHKVKRGDASAAAAGPIPGNYQYLYPKPLVSYEDVVRSKSLFTHTLERLHATMGTKYSVPTVGGRELDLHRLFIEVTVRGGLEQVVKHRRWREITSGFNFPSTATNASFILRKYYLSLIYHYEQIYFFKSEGWNPSATDFSRVPASPSVPYVMLHEPETPIAGQKQEQRNDEPTSTACPSVPSEVLSGPSPETQTAGQKRKKSTDEPKSTGLPLSTNAIVMGVIDGKFEHGYLVTVRVGTTTLKGVLYHSTGQDPSQVRSIAPYSSSIAQVPLSQRRRKLTKRDPSHPKPSLSGYNFFFQEHHARLKSEHSGRNRRISKIIGELWNKLTEAEKAVYQAKAVEDKERYRREMVAYKQRLQMGLVIKDAVPLQQRPADPAELMPVNLDLEMDEGDLHAINPDDIASDDGSDSGDDIFNSGSDSGSSQAATDATAAESGSVAEEQLSCGDAFELRRRPVAGTSDEGDRLDTDETAAGSKELDLRNDNS